MTIEEFERLKRSVALEMARKALEKADFSLGTELLTEDESLTYAWLEMLFYDGEISYYELWACCPRSPLPKEGA